MIRAVQREPSKPTAPPEVPEMPDDPKAVVREFVKDVQNDGNIEATEKYIAADVVDHSAMPGLPPRVDGAKAIFSLIRTGFPDHDAVIHDQIVEHWNVVDLLGSFQQMGVAPASHAADAPSQRWPP
jgi:hypothetical protein